MVLNTSYSSYVCEISTLLFVSGLLAESLENDHGNRIYLVTFSGNRKLVACCWQEAVLQVMKCGRLEVWGKKKTTWICDLALSLLPALNSAIVKGQSWKQHLIPELDYPNAWALFKSSHLELLLNQMLGLYISYSWSSLVKLPSVFTIYAFKEI